MSKKPEQSDLGISLRDMATILQTGKKLTRGAKNQLKISASEKELGQKQSELSFDSKKSIETKKEAKKVDKNAKKKEGSVKSVKMIIGEYMGTPDLQSYITSDDLLPRCRFSLQKFSVSQLGKNYFPGLVRVILKNNLSKQHYEVKRGQLKKLKTTKDNFLIDLTQPSGGRSDVRSITRDNGIVMVGENLAMIKINFEEWKDLFYGEIEEIRKEMIRIVDEDNEGQKMQEEKQGQQRIQEEQPNIEQGSQPVLHQAHQDVNFQPDKRQRHPQSCFVIQQEKSISFVQIQPNQSCEQLSSDSEDQKPSNSHRLTRRINQAGLIQNKFSQSELFNKFCIPGCDYILWPVLIYETVLGDPEQAAQVIKEKLYVFNEKEKHPNLFETVSKSSQGLFQPFFNKDIKSQSFISPNSSFEDHPQLQKFISGFHATIAPRLSGQMILQQQNEKSVKNQSQINLIIYPFGSGKLMYLDSVEEVRQQLFTWNNFSKDFINFYLLNTSFKETIEEISNSIEKLNDFSKLQVNECKIEEIRNSIDRLVKCNLDDKIFNGITLRYSNIQKKVLVLVFSNYKTTKNELIWLNIEQIFPNYTLPQLNPKNKFLIYFSNLASQRSLTHLMQDIYASYFYKPIANIVFTRGYYHQNSTQLSQLSESCNQIIPILSRCIECFYPIHKLSFYKCCFCENYCHKECSTKILNKSVQMHFDGIQDMWTCNACEPCTLCLQPLENKRISCIKCKNMFHQICGKLKVQQNTIHRDKYLCENCIQCKICQKKLKNLDYVLMKGGYQCINCHKAEQANQICHICKKQGDGRWAQCSREFCGKWIHKNCDKYIQSRNNFFSNSNEQVYFCPFCRKVEKRKLILKFIQIMAVFDEYQYFIGSDYEDILDYRYVIMNPMCFRKMYERCHEGAYDQNTKQNIIRDFELLISNALKYNMPKDQPHYQARILNILGHHTIDKFHEELECTEEQLIQGNLLNRLYQKKRELYKEIYERYLQIILNYKSQHSIVEVKKPKQALSKGEKMAQVQLGQIDKFVFSSRHLLKDVFRSSMLKFKIKKKSSTIENLFEIHKVIQAYKCPIKENFCFYHYWNSNVIFYCEICMEHYCCSTKCYRHNICSQCGLKGCACDVNECGCPPLKEKEKKIYEKLIHERYYDRREITENFKLCLRCACEKLNTKVCCYCEKAYEFYYDFETCKTCEKIYHKQCGDVHASQNLTKFFFKKEKLFPNQQLFSNTLRLEKTCYECSISRGNKPLMFEKLKSESLAKLMKLHKLCKYQLLIASIYNQNGVKLSLNDILNLVLNNYEDFLEHQPLFEQYRLNMPSIRLNNKLYKRFEERTDTMIRQQGLNKVKEVVIEAQKRVEELKQRNSLLTSLSLSDQCQDWLLNSSFFWRQLLEQRAKQCLTNNIILIVPTSQASYKKLRTQLLLQTHNRLKTEQKLKRTLSLNQQLSVISIITIPTSRKSIPISASCQKLPTWSKSLLQPSQPTIRGNLFGRNGNNVSINERDNKEDNRLLNELLGAFYEDQYGFRTFVELRVDAVMMKRREEGLEDERKGILAWTHLGGVSKQGGLFLMNSPIVYDVEKKGDDEHRIIEQDIQREDAEPQMSQQLPGIDNLTNPQPNSTAPPTSPIDIEAHLQSAINEMYADPQPHSQNQTEVSFSSIEQQMMKLHCSHKNLSKISKFKRLNTIHQIISKFLLRCFEFNKNVYRRGNTCILKADPTHWRVFKKGKGKNEFYEISLKKQEGKWYFSINQNTWWVDSIQQIISKLQPLVNLSNFRELADFLGFTFKFIPSEKAVHFTRFLQTNSLQDLSAKQKKQVLLQLYDKFEWIKNGTCKNKVTEIGKQEVKEYVTTKKKIFYLNKRKSASSVDQPQPTNKLTSPPPYISYQDLKKDLEETTETKKQQPIILTSPGDNVFIGPSPIHKLGLFARQNYPKHTTMVEYIGEVVSESMADVRQSRFHFGCYMFGLNRRNCDKREIIDATFKGNMARYLNHSCDPNCKARIEVVNNQPSIFIYSIREIAQFEELTYDYQFSVDANQKLICTCGAKNCQGRLN